MAKTDPATLRPTSELQPASTRAGKSRFAAWSPDGRQLAFLRLDGQQDAIVIKAAEGGPERDFPLQDASIVTLRWEPGGRSILFFGRLERKSALWRLDLQSREVSMVLGPPADRYEVLPQPAMIVLARQRSSGLEIVRVDLVSGAETVLQRFDRQMVVDLSVSHRGDKIGLVLLGQRGISICIVDLHTKTGHDVAAMSSLVNVLGWTPDDRELIVRQCPSRGASSDTAVEPVETVSALDVTTGSTRELSSIQVRQFVRRQYSPDGRHVAIETGGISHEVWALENATAALGR